MIGRFAYFWGVVVPVAVELLRWRPAFLSVWVPGAPVECFELCRRHVALEKMRCLGDFAVPTVGATGGVPGSAH